MSQQAELFVQVLDSSSRSPDLLYCSQCTAGFSSPIVLSEHVHNVHGVGLIAPKSISPGPFDRTLQIRRSQQDMAAASNYKLTPLFGARIAQVSSMDLVLPAGGSSSSSQLRDKSCAPSEDGLPHVRAPKQLKLSPSEGDLSNDKILRSVLEFWKKKLSHVPCTTNPKF